MTAIEDARALATRLEDPTSRWGDTDAARVVRALIAEYERLTAPPTDDEREALEEWSFEHRPILSMRDGSIASCKCMDRVFITGQEDWDQHIADAILASGFRRQGPVTDAQVEAAARVFYESQTGSADGFNGSLYRYAWERMARAALEAAREADR